MQMRLQVKHTTLVTYRQTCSKELQNLVEQHPDNYNKIIMHCRSLQKKKQATPNPGTRQKIYSTGCIEIVINRGPFLPYSFLFFQFPQYPSSITSDKCQFNHEILSPIVREVTHAQQRKSSHCYG